LPGNNWTNTHIGDTQVVETDDTKFRINAGRVLADLSHFDGAQRVPSGSDLLPEELLRVRIVSANAPSLTRLGSNEALTKMSLSDVLFGPWICSVTGMSELNM
jgi:hypothetical protein